MPILLEHFKEHCAADSETSVLSFLILHYLSGKVRDADHAGDMQLPFKTLEIPAFSFSALHFAPEHVAAGLAAPAPAVQRQVSLPALLLPSSPFLATPSQPPEERLFF
ncbi:MAG: hypothetical protein IPM81_21375 [Saprospirales bacterium]|nr:hypothetical protein [Saprospirales bacterium]